LGSIGRSLSRPDRSFSSQCLCVPSVSRLPISPAFLLSARCLHLLSAMRTALSVQQPTPSRAARCQLPPARCPLSSPICNRQSPIGNLPILRRLIAETGSPAPFAARCFSLFLCGAWRYALCAWRFAACLLPAVVRAPLLREIRRGGVVGSAIDVLA
jgi:hypothetical protein